MGTAERAEEDRDYHARLERMKTEKVQTNAPPRSVGTPPDDPRPAVREGAVLATLFNELGTIFRRIAMADAFEKKVTEAAKSPAAWLLLREELNPSKDPAP